MESLGCLWAGEGRVTESRRGKEGGDKRERQRRGRHKNSTTDVILGHIWDILGHIWDRGEEDTKTQQQPAGTSLLTILGHIWDNIRTHMERQMPAGTSLLSIT